MSQPKYLASFFVFPPATHIMTTKRQYLLLMAMVLLSTALRAGHSAVMIGLSTPPEFDGISYHLLAISLVRGDGYALGNPTAFRPPGYPLLLAGVYTLAGEQLALVRLLHAGLGTVLTALTYATGVVVFRKWQVGALAALVVALHPVLIYLSGSVLTETVFVTLVMAVIWLMAISQTGLTRTRTLALALLLGMLVLIRPSALIFAGLVALWCVVSTPLRSRGVMHAAVIVVGVALFILPWTVRNYVQFQALIPLATEGGVTFWSGNNALATGGVVEPSAATWPGPNPPAGLHGWPELSEKESEDRFYAAAWAWIKSHPQDFLALLPRKLARAWSLAYGNEARADNIPRWIAALYLLFPLAALGGLILSLHLWRCLVPIYLLLGSFTFTTLVFYGSTRQSAVLFPSAAILAAYAVFGAYTFVAGRLDSRRGGMPA